MNKSMTGFGRCEAADEERKFTVEMKGVNHRYLDANIRMPKKLNFFESAIRSLLKESVHRGKVDIFITYEDFSESQVSLKYNETLAAEYLEKFKMMEEKFSKKEMDVWFSANGINGHEKLKNKEIAKKYNVVPSNINYYLSKINTYIQNTPKILSKLSDIYDIMKECLNEQDHKKDLGDPIHF